MTDLSIEEIQDIVVRQKDYFQMQQTKSVEWRILQLKKLKAGIQNHEQDLYQALWQDLHKSEAEAYLTEYSIVMNELDKHIAHLKKWSKPIRVKTPLALFPSKSRIIYEPLGVSLIIAPWNYPFNLMMCPLIGSISAGCCSVMKPSPYSVNVSAVMERIIEETFHPEYICFVQGHRDTNELLLQQHFDMIFYTGSPNVGKVVMEAASKHLTPVVLELGGKSPCIVDEGANISFAAHRLAWGKTINAGQTCIAPDYLFVYETVKNELVEKLIQDFERFYGLDAEKSDTFCRIITDKAFNRLTSYLKDGKILYGGQTNAATRYIQPTLVEVEPEMPIMQEEIFGPILPIMTYNDLSDVVNFVNRHPKPLAFYFFGTKEKADKVLEHTTSGGACINDTLMHVANENLPFGGVGNSGMGKYHGKESFLAFSNLRSVIFSSNRIDMNIKYPPYNKFKWLKKFI
jgi:NAD-dependent aldehyde dehydrogenases